MEYGLELTHTNYPKQPAGDPMHCDCGARPEEVAAGIHYSGCNSIEGQPDDPSDHYGQ